MFEQKQESNIKGIYKFKQFMGGSFKQQQEICKDRWHTKWPAFPTRSFLDRFHSSTLWKTNIARENPHFSFGNTSSIRVHLPYLTSSYVSLPESSTSFWVWGVEGCDWPPFTGFSKKKTLLMKATPAKFHIAFGSLPNPKKERILFQASWWLRGQRLHLPKTTPSPLKRGQIFQPLFFSGDNS